MKGLSRAISRLEAEDNDSSLDNEDYTSPEHTDQLEQLTEFLTHRIADDEERVESAELICGQDIGEDDFFYQGDDKTESSIYYTEVYEITYSSPCKWKFDHMYSPEVFYEYSLLEGLRIADRLVKDVI